MEIQKAPRKGNGGGVVRRRSAAELRARVAHFTAEAARCAALLELTESASIRRFLLEQQALNTRKAEYARAALARRAARRAQTVGGGQP